MERNDSFLNDCDKCALFTSMNFTATVEKGGIDLTIRVKLAATRHFSYRQSYLWDGNVLTVVLIDSGVYGVCIEAKRSRLKSRYVSIVYQFDRSTCDTTFPRAYTVSWTQVARMFYRSSIILQQLGPQAYAKRNKRNGLNIGFLR